MSGKLTVEPFVPDVDERLNEAVCPHATAQPTREVAQSAPRNKLKNRIYIPPDLWNRP